MIHCNLQEHQVENKRGRQRQIDTKHFGTVERTNAKNVLEQKTGI